DRARVAWQARLALAPTAREVYLRDRLWKFRSLHQEESWSIRQPPSRGSPKGSDVAVKLKAGLTLRYIQRNRTVCRLTARHRSIRAGHRRQLRGGIGCNPSVKMVPCFACLGQRRRGDEIFIRWAYQSGEFILRRTAVSSGCLQIRIRLCRKSIILFNRAGLTDE